MRLFGEKAFDGNENPADLQFFHNTIIPPRARRGGGMMIYARDITRTTRLFFRREGPSIVLGRGCGNGQVQMLERTRIRGAFNAVDDDLACRVSFVGLDHS